tara:strand:- start:219 stop:413 length:195 start_codon:yes stop_codon:yes gene_type:complete
MAKYNVGDRVRILAETEALRSLWGKTGTVEASSEQYFGAVYELVLHEDAKKANSINEEWLQLAL